MVYATKQQMIDQYGEDDMIDLTDRADPPVGEINDTVLDQALVNASAVIDGYIGRRYNLPLASVPALLVPVCLKIVFYNLHRGRHTDEVRKEYEDAVSVLNKISSGDVVLDVGGKEPASAPAQVVTDAVDRSFSRKKGWW